MRFRVGYLLFLFATALAAGQTAPDDATLRKQALDMMRQNEVVQAAPLLEGLANRHPEDMVVQEQLGMALLGEAMSASSPEQSKAFRVRARAALQRAKELGDNSDLLNSVLPDIPEDGSVPAFSSTQTVEAEMREGENQFSHGDLRAAIGHYQKAFELDPKQYYAALFAGDASFKLNDYTSAATWFNRAIALNPNAESAHRYYADSLLAENKVSDARAQFIEALVAEPYKRSVWLGLNNLHGHIAGPVQRLHLQPQVSVTGAGDKVNINIEPAALGSNQGWGGVWVTYGGARAAWKKNHANLDDKRSTSLPEEAAAYGTALHVILDKDSGTLKAHPELARLKQVQAAGLLEAWVLIDQADQEIAQDYESYRSSNRDKIRRYLDEFIVPKIE